MSKKDKKVEETPQPQMYVVGTRYCLNCGKACIAVAFNQSEGFYIRSVGSAISMCCSSFTALVLLPAELNHNPTLPKSLPALIGVVKPRF